LIPKAIENIGLNSKPEFKDKLVITNEAID
jgi:hypothetical protein